MAAQVIMNSVVLGLTLALMAIGLTLIYGILLVVNFAHGEFYMLGGVFLYYATSLTVSATGPAPPSPSSR